jgi:hypothetical protein
MAPKYKNGNFMTQTPNNNVETKYIPEPVQDLSFKNTIWNNDLKESWEEHCQTFNNKTETPVELGSAR